jgi:hypothetical protein
MNIWIFVVLALAVIAYFLVNHLFNKREEVKEKQ